MENTSTHVVLPPSEGKPWLASRLLYRQVVNAPTLEPLGRIADMIFDPETCQLAGLIVNSTAAESAIPPARGIRGLFRRISRARSSSLLIDLDRIVALSGDVVMVGIEPGHASASRAMEYQPRFNDVRDLTILTLHGISLGTLSDLLLDERGSLVIGYVIDPTKAARAYTLPLADIEQRPPDPFELPAPSEPEESQPNEPQARETSAPAEERPPSAQASVIPASPQVRFGPSMIILVEDVEPLRREPVTVTSSLRDSPELVS